MGVSSLLFVKVKCTSLFPYKEQNIWSIGALMAKCSAVFPSLSCIFKIQAKEGVWQTKETMFNFLFSTATCRNVRPWEVRNLALLGSFSSIICRTFFAPAEAAMCTGNKPVLSALYTGAGLASNNCVKLMEFLKDEAKWRGVLPSLSPCVVRLLFHFNTSFVIPENVIFSLLV